MEHVNGNVEFRLREETNADIAADAHNGQLSLALPNVTMQKRESHSHSRARLGDGGSPFNIRHVNGNVRFESAAAAPRQ